MVSADVLVRSGDQARARASADLAARGRRGDEDQLALSRGAGEQRLRATPRRRLQSRFRARLRLNSYLLEERAQGSPAERPSEDDAVFRSGNRQASAKSAAGTGTPVFKWGLIALVAAVVIVAVILVYLKLSGPTTADTGRIATEPNPPLEQTVLPASRPEPETRRALDRPRDEPPAKPAVLEPAVETTHGLSAPSTRAPQAKVDAVIHVDRPTSGRLNCDNRRIEMLDGMPAGTVLELSCMSYLIVDAIDAGALRLTMPGREAERLGAAGQRLSGYRIEADRSDSPERQP